MDREQIVAEVRAHRQKPEWAEQQAQLQGWPPFSAITMPWSRLENRSKWPITFALFWLVFRDPRDATKFWNRLQFWEGATYRDAPDRLHKIQKCLFEALCDGHLQGWGKSKIEEIDHTVIPQNDWEHDLWWETGRCYSTANFPGKPPKWFDVSVDRQEVISWRLNLRSRREYVVSEIDGTKQDANTKKASTGADESVNLERQSPISEDAIDAPFRKVQDEIPSEKAKIGRPKGSVWEKLDNDLLDVADSRIANGEQQNSVLSELAARAPGAGSIESKTTRLRKRLSDRRKKESKVG